MNALCMAPSSRLPLCLLLLVSAAGAARVQADEDAGALTDEDAGMHGDGDAGRSPAPDAGEPDAGGFDGCSCETLEDYGGQRVHVCTGSQDPEVCERFTCAVPGVLQRPCDARDVRLCCQIDARNLYANLYTTCQHHNCEQGFRDQCADYGGTVFTGLCGGQDPNAGDDRLRPTPASEDRGLCAITQPGGSGRRAASGLLPMGALAWFAARRRRSER